MTQHESTSRPAARAAAIAALVCVALLLGACAPGTSTIRMGLDVRVNLAPMLLDGVMVVTIPAARPDDGVRVQPRTGPAFHIPPGHYPPPGQCRVWVPGVPPGQQSPPGACATLRLRVPAHAYLIIGER